MGFLLKKSLCLFLLWPLLTALALAAEPKEMVFRTQESALQFTADAFFNKVSGEFNTWQGALVFNQDNPLESSVIVKVDTTSINTQNNLRDNHLRSKSFLYVQQFPEATFVSQSFKHLEGKPDTYEVTGLLTIRGVSKTISFPVEIKREDNAIYAMASFDINRRDYGVNFRSVMNPIKPEVTVSFQIKAE